MKIIIAIVKKELIEILRDKLTLLFLILTILAFPVFNIVLNLVESDTITNMSIAISAENKEDYELVKNNLNSIDNLNVIFVETESPLDLLKERKVDFVVEIDSENINFIYNSPSIMSLLTAANIGDKFQREYYKTISQVYSDFRSINLMNENKNIFSSTNSIISMLIPTMLVLIATQSSSNLANNSFAGEKERKTFELLLLSGTKRSNIYIGKCVSLLIISVINAGLGLVSYFSTYAVEADAYSVIIIFIHIMFIAVISVFTSITISLFSSDVKNSQIINEAVLSLPLLLTAGISWGFINTNSTIVKFVPFVNLIISFCNSFYGTVDLFVLIVSLLESALIVVALFIISKLYIQSERAVR